MALTIGDNFSYQGAKPLDGRIKYDTLAAMKAMVDSTLYDGCLAYCVATDKTYQWKSTNTVDTDTGKWREFTSGGGTGGGHTIEDPEGTALTQRDTLQFGGDLEVSDDDENEKTVVAPHELTAAELAEIVTPLPSVPVNMPILFDESGAEYQVGWYKYSNGTKKPVYEKTVTGTLPTTLNQDNLLYKISDANMVKVLFVQFYRTSNSMWYQDIGADMYNCGVINTNEVVFWTKDSGFSGQPYSITLRYTKTTDTPT